MREEIKKGLVQYKDEVTVGTLRLEAFEMESM
jgi:hypothetical protein